MSFNSFHSVQYTEFNVSFYFPQDVTSANAADLATEPESVRLSVQKLYTYFNSYWIETVGPERFSVYRDVHRTNNAIESWNRWFNARCKKAHPTFFQFMRNYFSQFISEIPIVTLLLFLCRIPDGKQR